MSDFRKWCDEMERRYDVMPRWYWDEAKRRAAFETATNTNMESKHDRK